MPVSEDSITAFKDLVESGKATELRALLARHPELREVLDEPWFSFDAPAIVAATARRDRELIDVLLDAGADINARSAWAAGPYSALHQATGGAVGIDLDLAHHLIARGADIDIHAAAGLGRLDLLADFVAADASVVHQRGPDGQTPLSMAANPEVAAWLLDRGAEIDSRCLDHASTPAQYAVTERPEVTRYLVERGAVPDIFMASALGDVALLHRVLAKHPASLQTRIDDTTCSLDHPTGGGNIYVFTLGNQATPLHVAAHRDRPQIVDPLIDAGLAVDVRGDYDDCTPLHIAAWDNHPAVAERLLARGADIEARTGEKHRGTPLGWATVAGSVAMVEFLIANGADINDDDLLLAKAGEEGQHQAFSSGTAAAFRKIHELLASHREARKSR